MIYPSHNATPSPYSFTQYSLWKWLYVLLLIGACGSPDPSTVKQVDVMSDKEEETITTARAIHESVLIFDAHADIAMPTTSATFLSKDGRSKVAPDKLSAGGFGVVVMCIAVPPGPRTSEGNAAARVQAFQQLEAVHSLISGHPDTLVLVKSANEIKAAQEANKIGVLLGLQNARSLEQQISSIDTFYNAGVRMFALNHLGHNAFADSSRPFYDGSTKSYEVTEEHGGLSELGQAAVRRVNALGGIVDVSQMSKAATLQAVQLSKAPVVASHSNVRTISDVSRNLSDEEIDQIGANGGVIHISAFRAYLLDYSDDQLVADIKAARRKAGVDEVYSYPFELYWEIEDPAKKMDFLMSISEIIGPADINHMIDHIDYIVKRIGIDHVGIGTDFNHGSGIDEFVDAADALNVTIALVRRGYSKEDIEKIWGGNFLRVFLESEKAKSQF